MAEPEHTSVVDAILDLKVADPFAPFRVVMTSGDKYLIESGENLVELRTEFFLCVAADQELGLSEKEPNRCRRAAGTEATRPAEGVMRMPHE